MSGHTPGPWEAVTLQYCDRIVHEGGNIVAEAHSYSNGAKPDKEERHANARLIAASPDLLAVAKAALPILEGIASELSNDIGAMHQEGGKASEEAWQAANEAASRAMACKAAIAKAEGTPVEPFDLPCDHPHEAIQADPNELGRYVCGKCGKKAPICFRPSQPPDFGPGRMA